MKSASILHLLLYIPMLLWAQQDVVLEPKSPPISFKRIGEDQGLSEYLLSIVQDQKGFIWMGTSNGVVRFDGLDFEAFKYNSENPQGIAQGRVLKMFLDQSDRVWAIVGDEWLYRFDPSIDDFSRSTA